MIPLYEIENILPYITTPPALSNYQQPLKMTSLMCIMFACTGDEIKV